MRISMANFRPISADLPETIRIVNRAVVLPRCCRGVCSAIDADKAAIKNDPKVRRIPPVCRKRFWLSISLMTLHRSGFFAIVAGAIVANGAAASDRAVPLVDHHLHLFSPAVAKILTLPALPAI